ncbi:MAG: MFS transporter [Woeseia sp.]
MTSRAAKGGRAYANYVLFVLFLVYVTNFIDRLIVSILADEIKRDLQISDAQLGFLAGTAFAVFYALFGLPLGRLADLWVRKKLIAIGLAGWSLMTILSGTANNLLQLALFRCGVGIGEASASPAAFSLLCDYFPARLRATVLAIYTSGAYFGMGLGVFLGGWIISGWKSAYPSADVAPLGLAAWQAAFVIVGFPGILLAGWVATLKEPVRGQTEGIYSTGHPHPFKEAMKDVLAIMPPLTLVNLVVLGGKKAVVLNIVIAAALVTVCAALVRATGDLAQWLVLGTGIYATCSWIQNLALRDPPAFKMMFGSKAFMLAIVGFSSINFVAYGLAIWLPSFFIRVHEMEPGHVGMVVGLSIALGGVIGVNLGGYLSDLWCRKHGKGRIYLGLWTVAVSVPAALTLFLTDVLAVALIFNFVVAILLALWVGSATSTVTELVLPRMRAVASAFYFLLNVFIGLALGPYLIGLASDLLIARGSSPAESLRSSLVASVCFYVVPAALLFLSRDHVHVAVRNRIEIAMAAGERELNVREGMNSFSD